MTTMPETTGMGELMQKWNWGRVPPPGNEYVGRFFMDKWEAARKEKIDRLGQHNRWLDLHSQWRGKRRRKTYPVVGANYLYKTMNTFCAVLTEKTPQSEIRSDENPDQAKVLDAENQTWWQEEELQDDLFAAVQNMQIYGTCIEKGRQNYKKDTFELLLVDPFNFFPAPGFKRGNLDIPYVCEVDFLEPWEIRATFDLPDDLVIPTDADEQLVGGSRETVRGGKIGKAFGDRHYPNNYAPVGAGGDSESMKGKTLVIEIWCKDDTKITEPVMADQVVTDDLGREIGVEEVDTGKTITRPAYLDGIRKITFCPALMDADIKGILDDQPNPSVNWELLQQQIDDVLEKGRPEYAIDQMGNRVIDQETGGDTIQYIPVEQAEAEEYVHGRAKERFWLWGRYPYSVTGSQLDTSQWWYFSMIEALEEMQGESQKLLSRYMAFLYRNMFPIIKNPVGSGVQNSEFTNAPGLVVNPTIAASQYMGYIDPPNPPRGLLEILEFILMQIDVISQTPEVTEGRRPKGVSAASAIIALQDKASTLFQPQIRAVDKLVRNRGRMFVHFVLNYGDVVRPVKIDKQFIKYRGIDFLSSFKMHVESGSSAPITKAGRRNQYVELFKLQAMDLETLLDMLEIPNAPTVVERIMEQTTLPGAIDLLIQAGLPEEAGQKLYAYLSQDQQGQGRSKNREKGTGQPAGPPGGSSESMKSIFSQMDTTG